MLANVHCTYVHNTDMEWMIGEGSNEVDIGYVPLMKLFSYSSMLWEPTLESPSGDVHDYFDKTWDEEIAFSTATQEIERLFYPFKQVRSFELVGSP